MTLHHAPLRMVPPSPPWPFRLPRRRNSERVNGVGEAHRWQFSPQRLHHPMADFLKCEDFWGATGESRDL